MSESEKPEEVKEAEQEDMAAIQDVLGLTDEDINPNPKCDEVLKEEVDCSDSKAIRKFVGCLAFKKVKEENKPLRDAMREAWSQLKLKCEKK